MVPNENEASIHLIQSIIISNAIQQPENTDNKSMQNNMGEKCRIKEHYRLFDKMEKK